MNTYNFTVTSADGVDQSLRDYEGQVLLIVNTASKCGFTPQYKSLQELHERFSNHGFSVLGFPCNQFAKQEPGSNSEIQTFCEVTYGVTFPVFGKLNVNGADAHPLYKFLTKEAPGVLGSTAVKWNFTKFLIGRDGHVLKRYAPKTTPDDIATDIAPLVQ